MFRSVCFFKASVSAGICTGFLYTHYNRKGQAQDIYSQTERYSFSHKLKKIFQQNYFYPEERYIEEGYGEFILYDKRQPGSKISKESYKKFYEQLELLRKKSFPHSYQVKVIRKKLQTIDPDLDISFIPKTLYELLYITNFIEEDMKNRRLYKSQNNSDLDADRKGSILSLRSKPPEIKNDFHVSSFLDLKPESSSEKEKLQDLAFQVNQRIVEKVTPKGPFKFSEINFFVGKEIEYLENFSQNYPSYKDLHSTFTLDDVSCKFGEHHHPRTGSRFFIRGNRRSVEIIQKAVDFECDPKSRDTIVLYRAGELLKPPGETTSLSWGVSLFSGVFYDPTACVFFYAFDRDVYALRISQTEENVSFHVPKLSTIRHLFSRGEYHHPRTLVANDIRDKDCSFIKGLGSKIEDFMFSPLNQKQFNEELCYLFNRAILLVDNSGPRPFSRI